MSYLMALAVGLLVHRVLRDRRPRRRAAGLATASAVAVAVPMAIPLLGAGAVVVWVSKELRSRRRASAADAGLLGRMLLIGLTAGLPPAGALEVAVSELEPALAEQVRAVLRAAGRRGLAAALSETDGPASPLFRSLARAQLSGASSLRVVASFVDEERHARRAAALEAAHKLPVKLAVPLALLILPGFVLLTIGPAVVATVQRLLGPFLL